MKSKIAVLAFFFALGIAGTAAAQTSTTSQVTEINELSVTGSPSLTINATNSGAGSGLRDATGSGTYAVTTNGTNKRITAALDLAMPANVTLRVNFTAPTASGTSAGAVALTALAQNVVTGITSVDQTAIPIAYTLSANVTAGVVASTTRTITYTLTNP